MSYLKGEEYDIVVVGYGVGGGWIGANLCSICMVVIWGGGV